MSIVSNIWSIGRAALLDQLHVEGGLVGRSVSSFDFSEDVFQVIHLFGRHCPQIRNSISSELQSDTTSPSPSSLKFKFVVLEQLMFSFHRKKNNPCSLHSLIQLSDF
jgi:hypothetical protein